MTSSPEAPQRLPRSLILTVVVAVAAVGIAGYAWKGSHDAWDPKAREAPPPAGHAGTGPEQIAAMVGKLEERLKQTPQDAEGWSMLGRSYSVLGRFPEAVAAFKKVAELQPADAQALADQADALAMSRGRKLDGEPEQLIQQALKLDPKNLKALALAGTIAFDRGDYAGAVLRWEAAMAVAEPGSELSRGIAGGIAEARVRAGMPMPGASAPAAAPPAAASAPAPKVAVADARITGRVELADSLKAQASPEDTVFVFARAAEGPRMPLAIVRKQVKDLPFDFTLDDSTAMNPQMKLSSVPQVIVGARISRSGNATPQPGDLQGSSAPVAVGTRDLRLEIREIVR